jgi:transcriptional regulator with XRE-family HTH domain
MADRARWRALLSMVAETGWRRTVPVTRLSVEPSVLRWARETAGLDIDTAATRIGVKPNRVSQWEGGSVAPTINQIRTMADVYARPLAALLMSEPPAEDLSAICRTSGARKLSPMW